MWRWCPLAGVRYKEGKDGTSWKNRRDQDRLIGREKNREIVTYKKNEAQRADTERETKRKSQRVYLKESKRQRMRQREVKTWKETRRGSGKKEEVKRWRQRHGDKDEDGDRDDRETNTDQHRHTERQ